MQETHRYIVSTPKFKHSFTFQHIAKLLWAEKEIICSCDCDVTINHLEHVLSRAFTKLQLIESVLNLLDTGIVSHSTSLWTDPIVSVSKPNGSVRLCMNY